ncbi:DUF4349 domain-containing protein [Chryseobacterium sp. SSA4.19]|uniref:DUF4349 domain-containing protein n=1 Tax=Chryseobacterium sp. SSA4.19 TaxID=2919915 RepID=UPI001F4D599F|nr:DUF4349 domain-containing protein [Chryseobacterium sp. SSA4.19]MCJ8154687.1 DUF4349 domain-containing protein [Chryseobacterium sp. SSA4.19]
MKKFLLALTVSVSCIMCKKGEATASGLENTLNSADSTVSAASEKIRQVDDQANAALDSANVRIKEFENIKNDVKDKMESTSKIADSLSDKISSVRLETKAEKKDSVKKSEKIIVNVPAPKVIRETRIVYKDKPKKENNELNILKNKLLKTGVLELTVEDADTAKEMVKEQVEKYDGLVRSENISLNNNDYKTAYLKIKIPIQKFDYLMDDLSHNIGKVESKSVELSGQDFIQNTMCEIDITLYGKDANLSENKKTETFGEKSFAAVSSGWNVITSIFLFILPLWPLFLIAGAGYYFYKRKTKNITNNDQD